MVAVKRVGESGGDDAEEIIKKNLSISFVLGKISRRGGNGEQWVKKW